MELRQARLLSQEQLGEDIGLTDRELRRIEHGQVDISVGTLVKLANALNVAIPDLFQAPTRLIVQRRGRPRQKPRP